MRKIAEEVAFLVQDDTEISWQMSDILNLLAEKLDAIEEYHKQPGVPEKCAHLTIHYDQDNEHGECDGTVGKCRDCGAIFKDGHVKFKI